MSAKKQSRDDNLVDQEVAAGAVAVYSFQVWDRSIGTNVTAPAMGTAAAIRRLKGMADLESRRWVNTSDVDAAGFYAGS
jgi:NAD(P)-dependent dehydrogenase (short-subunit alcohol dehydrogenase family)